ncbi:DUF3169 family protein [Amphibacillus jilinensis]|uniref:DUF3169 family protein n=1 Tax=Amphibacillus jilinensis TaxID=1216008 RepID=UPI0003193D24|nr:DUF3169 family protein [Amphibacillus jilinensis]
MKGMRDFGKLLLWLVLGGVAGFLLVFVFEALASLWYIVVPYTDVLVEQIFWLQVGLVIIFYFPALFLSVRAKKWMNRINTDLDLEDDTFDKRVEQMIYRSLLFNRLFYVFSFTLFGLSIDGRNQWIIGSILIFVIFCVASSLNEVKAVRMVQKKDPMKKGDPTSFKYAKELLESLDEAEKLIIYKTGYHTFKFMEFALIVIFGFAFFTKTIFNTGNAPILVIGLIWLVQSIVYFCYAKKFDS